MNWDKLFALVKAISAMATVGVLAYLGESGKDGGFVNDLWAAAKTASPLAAMFSIIMYMRAEAARNKAQQELLDRTVSFVEATNQQSNSLENMVTAVKEIGNAITNRLSQQATGGSRGRRGR